jgi:hypothetical protein
MGSAQRVRVPALEAINKAAYWDYQREGLCEIPPEK